MWRRPVAPPVRRTEGRTGDQQLLTTASPRPALVRMDPCTALYRQPHCSVADLCHVLGPDPEATVPRAAEYLEEAGVAGGRSGPAVVPAVLGHHALRPQAGREEGALHPGTVEHGEEDRPGHWRPGTGAAPRGRRRDLWWESRALVQWSREVPVRPCLGRPGSRSRLRSSICTGWSGWRVSLQHQVG